MPLPFLSLFVQMMPVIQAREALHQMTVIAMGTGNFKKADASRIRADWTGRAATPQELDLARVPPELARSRVEALGFKVTVE